MAELEKDIESIKDAGAKKTPAWPCILIIIFLPFILLFIIGAFLFMPIDYLIFKRSRYHRDFGGKYKFLAGAHFDNRLYTIIKKEKLPVLYAKGSCSYDSMGYFFTGKTLITMRNFPVFDKKTETWYANDIKQTAQYNAEPTPINLAEMEEKYLREFSSAVPGVSCDKVIFLIEKKRAQRKYGKAAIEAAKNYPMLAVYEKRKLKCAVLDIINETEKT